MRFIHTADNHLRAEQYNSPKRGADFTRGFEQVITTAQQEGIDLIVCAGDLLDSVRPSQGTIDDLSMLQSRLVAARITCLVITGNHDDTPKHWTSIFKRMTDTRYGFVPIDGKVYTFTDHMGEKVSFYGVPSLTAVNFRAVQWQPADYLVVHMPIQEFAGFPHPGMITMQDLDAACDAGGYKSVLVGDLHITQSQYTEKGRLVTYPGSTELTDGSHDPQKYVAVHDTTTPDKVQFVKIRTRQVFHVRIEKEEDVAIAISNVTSNADREPLVFAHYDPSIPAVLMRLRAALPLDKVILRCCPIPLRERQGGNDSLKLVVSQFDNVSIESTIVASVDAASPVFNVLKDLCNVETDSSSCLNAYLSKRTAELGISL